MKDCHLRARIPNDEYLNLKIAADRFGLTLSEYVRNVLLRDRQALTQEQFLIKIDAKLTTISQAPTKESSITELEPMLLEILLLSREIANERNAQILSRVGSQLNNIYPNRKK
jgi:hypothetical protein